MRAITRILCSVAASLILVSGAFAQDTISYERRPSVGIVAGLALNQHSGNFEQLPGVPNCGSIFTNGFGIGPDLGLQYRLPIDENLSIAVRGLYLSHGGTFNADEHIPLSVGGVLTAATDRHTLDVSLSSLAMQPIAQYDLTPQLGVFAGLQLSYLLSASFTQHEELTSPSNGVFYENRQRTRNQQSGSIPDVSTIGAAIVVGVGYQLPLNSTGTLHAVPQAFFTIGLADQVSGIDWKTNTFNAAVAVEYSPRKEVAAPPPPPPPPPPAPTPVPPPPIAASIRAVGLTNDGTETPAIDVVVEELYAKNLAPILPFVFFDSVSTAIPNRMHMIGSDEAVRFEVNKVATSNALTTHMDMLNIIGSRLAASPNTRVTLTGIVHSTTAPAIARARAESVRDYFTRVWKIAKNRIVVQTQPSQVASNLDPDIITEENRVEIASNDESLFDPLVTVDTVRAAEPPALRIYPFALHISRASAWHIAALQNGQVIASWDARDSVLPAHLDWQFTDRSLPKYPGSLMFELTVTDSIGRSTTSSTSLPIRQVTLGKERATLVAGKSIERYNLIVFDRGSSSLTQHHRRLTDRIRAEIKPNSSVSVIGYTDRVGEAAYNRRLSEDRAQVVAKALNLGSDAQVRGIGETQDLYSNLLPEGRFFCRTVVITIETQQKTP